MTTYTNTSLQRQSRIHRACQRYGISSLMHFTRLENLSSIMKNGVLSRIELSRRNIPTLINDTERFDRQLDATCLSISFPNYQMFYRYRSNSSHIWVVLQIDIHVLLSDCAFCLTNAASNIVRHIPIEQRKQPEALDRLFEDYMDRNVAILREDLDIPRNYPTNPQAEILAFTPIPQDLIQAVYVEKREQVSNKGYSDLFCQVAI